MKMPSDIRPLTWRPFHHPPHPIKVYKCRSQFITMINSTTTAPHRSNPQNLVPDPRPPPRQVIPSNGDIPKPHLITTEPAPASHSANPRIIIINVNHIRATPPPPLVKVNPHFCNTR